MISNKHKRMIAFYMLKELKGKINKEDLIDWFISFADKRGFTVANITVKDLIILAENIGIEVRS
jgi:hypothetical protein